MMVGTVTVVTHDTLFTVTTVVLGAPVDAVAGTDVVSSVQKGITLTAHPTERRFPTLHGVCVCVCVNSRMFGVRRLCLQELSSAAYP